MPSWNELVSALEAQKSDSEKNKWLFGKLIGSLQQVGKLRGGRNVLFYASAFLQKPQAHPMFLQITQEEINGFMSSMHGMDWSKGLTLIMHTPGGITNSTETIVAYLRSKFPNDIEVIVPTYAMSAGTMISLCADRIIMGRQSQLGPIDPQMPVGGRTVSAVAILDQFERAKKEISANRNMAHLWAPILPSLGPALLQEAQNAIDYSEKVVAGWLMRYMFNGQADAEAKGNTVASYFSRGSDKKSHGRRIDREEAREQGVVIEDLESSQDLQEAVLTAYHLMTILFEKSPAVKAIISERSKMWIKNIAVQPPVAR
jgi:hypothetical protein